MARNPNHLSCKPSSRTRFFADGELTCSGPSCGAPIPAGHYGRNKRLYLCSNACVYRWNLAHQPLATCTLCGTKFPMPTRNVKHPFCSPVHYFEWRKLQTDQAAGPFSELLRDFMQSFVPEVYAPSTENTIRCHLAAFFEDMQKQRVRSLNAITPKLVNGFVRRLARRRPKSAPAVLSAVKKFFNWAILEGQFKGSCPVLDGMHMMRRPKRLPRPYSAQEEELIWKLLEAEGDLRLLVAFAIASESGLRGGEIANLRVSDVNLEAFEAFVRLPNKQRIERHVPFHRKAHSYLSQWLKARGQHDHDVLLTSKTGRPMKAYAIRNRLNEVLCGAGKLERFSLHRARHSAATKYIRAGGELSSAMATFGWRSPAVAQGYVAISNQQLHEKYDRLMSTEAAEREQLKNTLTLEEFFSKGDPASTDTAKSA